MVTYGFICFERMVIVNKIVSAFSILLIVFLLFGCQNTAVSSETATSPESSIEEVAALSFAHTAFQTKEELFDFLRQNSDKKSVNGVNIQNFIKENQITIFEPTFTPPEGFHFYCVEIWYGYSAYIYVTDAYIERMEERRSSREAAAKAAAQSMSIPQSSYEIKTENPTGNSSSRETVLTGSDSDLVFYAENVIVLQWCTAVWEDPLTHTIENQSLKPLGKSENPKYYYAANDTYGAPIDYQIYWETDGHFCFARFPAAFFNEETILEICSFKTTTVPLR